MTYKQESRDGIGKIICQVFADTQTKIATLSIVQAVQDLIYSHAKCDAAAQDMLVLVSQIYCYITC